MMNVRLQILIVVALIGSGCRDRQIAPPPIATTSPAKQPLVGESDSTSRSRTDATDSAAPRIVKLADGITVNIQSAGDSFVEIEASVCIEEGFLEQVACSPNTREHESLVVIRAKPSQIHYAMLLAKWSPGAPGKWVYKDDGYTTIDPTGERIDIFVRVRSEPASHEEVPIRTWIRKAAPDDIHDNDELQAVQPHAVEHPMLHWVFGGSRFESNPAFMGPGEHYVADMTGSIIGLVTFGDEVIGYARVLADQADVEPPIWEVNTVAIPPVDTPVTLILRRIQKSDPSEAAASSGVLD